MDRDSLSWATTSAGDLLGADGKAPYGQTMLCAISVPRHSLLMLVLTWPRFRHPLLKLSGGKAPEPRRLTGSVSGMGGGRPHSLEHGASWHLAASHKGSARADPLQEVPI